METAPLLFLVAILAVFYLLLIRPQAKRARQQAQMQNAVEVDDQVMLTSGFYGTVVAVLEDRVEVELAPGTVVTVAKGAIGRVEVLETETETDDEFATEDDVDLVADDGAETGPSLAKRDPQES